MASSSDTNEEGVIVISVNDHSPEFIIQKILGVEVLPDPFTVEDGIEGYEWKVDTKYYTATINLFSVVAKTDFKSDFCDKIRATIFYFDGKEPKSFDDVLSWLPSLEKIPSEVQLLVCNNCDYDENNKKRVLTWCVENEFELVEISPLEEIDDEDGGLFSKSKGYGRIIEALQSHMWSNLVMKEDIENQNQRIKGEDKSVRDSKSSPPNEKSPDEAKRMTVENEEVLLEEQWLQKAFAGDDPDGESFEALFSKFASMKEKASNLTGEERKKYAEKVAVAFWKAMGGEEDEIAGLDDD